MMAECENCSDLARMILKQRMAAEVMRAQAAKLNLRKIQGDLVSRAEAVDFVMQCGLREREALLHLPALIAQDLAIDFGLDAAAVEKSLRDWFDDFLKSRARAQQSR